MTDLIFIGANDKLTQEDVFKRFKENELVSIYSAAKASVDVEIWLDRFKAATYLDKTDAEFVNGIYKLELAGLIAAGRAAEILS